MPAASAPTPLDTPSRPAAGGAEQERDQGEGVLSDARRRGNHTGKGGHLCRGLHTHTGAPGPCLSAPLASSVLSENLPGFEENEVTSGGPGCVLTGMFVVLNSILAAALTGGEASLRCLH